MKLCKLPPRTLAHVSHSFSVSLPPPLSLTHTFKTFQMTLTTVQGKDRAIGI